MGRSSLERAISECAPGELWPEQAAPDKGAPWVGRPAVASRTDDADGHIAWLLQTIEAEIIPRLMLVHQTARRERPHGLTGRTVPGPDEVSSFADRVLAHDAADSAAWVESRRAEGMVLDTVYLDLLAPAARLLGDRWLDDQIDFTQVTLGLWRIQQVMYDLSPSFQQPAAAAHGRRALLVALPGSQHSLGLFMVAEFFRRAGWAVCSEPLASVDDLFHAVRSEWFDLIGFSIGTERQVSELASVILRSRVASRNADVAVLVGGPLVLKSPESIAELGADGAAFDAPQAVALAEQLIEQLAANARIGGAEPGLRASVAASPQPLVQPQSKPRRSL
jgi:MerR family transcriptional regulator, light-induced transcriptional regulator